MPIEVKKPGEQVEGFRVIALLGHGAESVIYLVQDPKNKQIWALKHVVKEGEKSQRFLDQAEAEYAVAQKVNSTRVRKIARMIRKKASLLGGTTELFLVMEHVDGVSCERKPPNTVRDVAFVCEQVAHGMADMHRAGFVHADMKPNNVIVDDELHAKIIDLGQSCKSGTVKLRIQGTPDYIAPEQVHLKAITPKTDVYNLGAAMYWMLTRQFVPTALAKTDSLMGSVDSSLMQRPRRVVELQPKVPEMFDELVMKCVEINPDDRPGMEHVADQLNLIRARIEAEITLRKSGQLPRIVEDASPNGRSKAGGSAMGLSALNAGSGVMGSPGESRAGSAAGGSGAGSRAGGSRIEIELDLDDSVDIEPPTPPPPSQPAKS